MLKKYVYFSILLNEVGKKVLLPYVEIFVSLSRQEVLISRWSNDRSAYDWRESCLSCRQLNCLYCCIIIVYIVGNVFPCRSRELIRAKYCWFMLLELLIKKILLFLLVCGV